MTDDVYLTSTGEIYVEFYGKDGAYKYVRINQEGLATFVDKIICASKNTYWIDYVDLKVIQAHDEIRDWFNSLFDNSEIDFPLKETKEEVKEEVKGGIKGEVQTTDFTADDIPF